jgi:hypothetical protein
VQRRTERVDDLRRQIEKLVRDLNGYYRAPQSFAAAGALPDTVRVLHVSDVHLDPVGLTLTREIAAEFDVAFIIDTGDINHYGSDVEAMVVASEVPTGWPYVFVPGNHDSPAITAALDALPHVTVLDETSTVEAGIRVFGVADPASRRHRCRVRRERDARGGARAIAARLQLRMRSGEETPTVVAMHNPGMAEPFTGVVPTRPPRPLAHGGPLRARRHVVPRQRHHRRYSLLRPAPRPAHPAHRVGALLHRRGAASARRHRPDRGLRDHGSVVASPHHRRCALLAAAGE